MACGSCHQSKSIHQVRFPNGTTLRYASEGDAKRVADKTPGAEYQLVKK